APARAASAVSATTATPARRRRRFLDVRRFRWRNRFLDRFRMPVAVLLRAVLARLGPAIASPAAAPRKLAARGRDLHARICVGERFVGACAAFGRARRIRLFGRGLAALRCASFASRALRCRLLACFLARALSRARALAFRRGLFCRVSFGRGTLLALHAAACARRLAFGREQCADGDVLRGFVEIELAAANLIRDAFLQARVLEHLALAERSLILINDALELATADHERRVRRDARTDARLPVSFNAD